ncbi:MAG: lactate utilization protein LutB domain-containing protein, partial [Rubripirellula sp.]
IPLHHQLLAWRKELVGQGLLSLGKRISMRGASLLFRYPTLFTVAGKVGRTGLKWAPRWMTHNRLNKWTIARELPEPPAESFREWYKKNRKG